MNVNGPKFKYEDKVFVYFDPRGMVDSSALPVMECEIYGYDIKIESRHDHPLDVSVSYEVAIRSSFDEPMIVPEKYVHPTERDAAEFALGKLKDRAESAMVKAEELAEVIEKLRAANPIPAS